MRITRTTWRWLWIASWLASGCAVSGSSTPPPVPSPTLPPAVVATAQALATAAAQPTATATPQFFGTLQLATPTATGRSSPAATAMPTAPASPTSQPTPPPPTATPPPPPPPPTATPTPTPKPPPPPTPTPPPPPPPTPTPKPRPAERPSTYSRVSDELGDACDYTCQRTPPIDLPVDLTAVTLASDGQTLRIVFEAAGPIPDHLGPGERLEYHVLINGQAASIDLIGTEAGWKIWGVANGERRGLSGVNGSWDGLAFTVWIPWSQLDFLPDHFDWAVRAIWQAPGEEYEDMTPEGAFP